MLTLLALAEETAPFYADCTNRDWRMSIRFPYSTDILVCPAYEANEDRQECLSYYWLRE